METLAKVGKMLCDVAPNGAGRLFDCRSYKDFAPTELVSRTAGCGSTMPPRFRNLLSCLYLLHIRSQAVAE